MARERNTNERRAQIIQGMIEVMADRGYERASISAIAKASGLSSGLVHYHFDRKLDILLQTLTTLQSNLQHRIERFVRPAPNAEEALVAHVNAYVARGQDSSPLAVKCWVAICAAALNEEAVREATEAVVEDALAQLTERVVAVWKERGLKVSRDRTSEVVAGIFAGIHGSFTMVCAAPNAFAFGFASSTLRALTLALVEQTAAKSKGANR